MFSLCEDVCKAPIGVQWESYTQVDLWIYVMTLADTYLHYNIVPVVAHVKFQNN